MPVWDGVKGCEVAVDTDPLTSAPGTATVPTDAADEVQSASASIGPQTEKSTVPAGSPPSLVPVTVAVSVRGPPRVTGKASALVVRTGTTGSALGTVAPASRASAGMAARVQARAN